MNDYMNYIEVDPDIMLGKPVIKGTRLTVELILEELSVGKKGRSVIASLPEVDTKGHLGCFGIRG